MMAEAHIWVHLERRDPEELAFEALVRLSTAAVALEDIRDALAGPRPDTHDLALRVNDVTRYLKGSTDAPTS